MDTSLQSIDNPVKQSMLLRLAAAVVAVVVVLLLARGDFPSMGEDSEEYRNLMLNRWELVHQPFSSRFLHPMTISLLMRATGISIESAVMGVAIAALLMVAAEMTWIFTKPSAWSTCPICLTRPFCSHSSCC